MTPGRCSTCSAATACGVWPRLSKGGTPYTDVDLTSPLALVLGNEANGLPPQLEDRLDARVTIPMGGGAESLNVSTAAAVLCFEVARRRSNLHAMEEAR